MSELNLTAKYPVKGLLQSLQQGEISITEVELRINGYMNAISIKAKGEMKLEILKELHHKKSHQALCDMVPESNTDHAISVCKGIRVQSHHLVKKEG
jgi:hypothetical protein